VGNTPPLSLYDISLHPPNPATHCHSSSLPSLSFLDTRTRAIKQEWTILVDPVTQAADAGETAIARTDRLTTRAAALIREKESEGGTLLFQFESRSGSVFNGRVPKR